MDVATLAGSVSTALFVSSTVPMVVRAFVTRDMASYSRTQLAITNLGNLVHSLYVLSLPLGPIHVLWTTHFAVALFMLVWHVRFGGRVATDAADRSARG